MDWVTRGQLRMWEPDYPTLRVTRATGDFVMYLHGHDRFDSTAATATANTASKSRLLEPYARGSSHPSLCE